MKTEKHTDRRRQTTDERQQLIHAKATQIGAIWLLLCLGAATCYRLARGGGLGWEWFAIALLLPIMRVAKHLFGDQEQPKDYLKRPLPTGSSQSERRARFRSYLVDAFCFCLVPLVLGVGWLLADPKGDFYQFVQGLFPELDRLPLVLVTSLLNAALFFFVFLLTRYLYTERVLIPDYNRMLAELDEDEAVKV